MSFSSNPSVRSFNPLLPYEERFLSCGAKVIHHFNPRIPVVAFDAWIHTGGCNDSDSWQGISHFYEHMYFKGSERHGAGVLDQLVKSLGGDCNAATSMDYTHYDAAVPKAGWREVLDVLLDALLHPIFDPHELDHERNVVIEEIARSESIPWSVLYKRFSERTFAATPYRRDVLGTVECLQQIDREALHTYRRQRYVPRNTTFCVAGDVELNALLDELEKLTEGWNGDAVDTNPATWSVIERGDDITIPFAVQQGYLALGYPVGEIVGTPEEYALEAASSILGEGRSSRIVKRLKLDLGIVSNVSVGFWPFKHAGLFVIAAGTTAELLPQVETEIHNELEKFAESGIAQAELEKTKTLHRANYYFDHEKNVAIAGAYGYADILTSVEEAVRYQDELERLTVENVNDAFRRMMQPEKLVAARVVPNGKNPIFENDEFDGMI